jgi:hypothetical protein
MPSATWSGSPSCFLFSITFDLKLPYHARELLKDRENNNGSNNNNDLTTSSYINSTPLAFYAQPDTFYIGNGDLCLEHDLLNGSSEIENCYGCGLVIPSVESCCLLAGTPFFTIDVLEVFAVTL